jgi:hypothetical protein
LVFYCCLDFSGDSRGEAPPRIIEKLSIDRSSEKPLSIGGISNTPGMSSCTPPGRSSHDHPKSVVGSSEARRKMGFIPAFIRMQMLDKRMARAIQHKN